MKIFLVVFLVFCSFIGDNGALPLDGRSETVQPIEPREVHEISLKLLPPEPPQHHHHHHHEPSPQMTTTTVAPTTTSNANQKAEILRYEYENLPDGGYRFLYETSDGQRRDEVGYFRDVDKLGRILTVRGSYSYYGDDGELRIVRYVADENGYRQEEGQPPPAALPPHVIATLAGR